MWKQEETLELKKLLNEGKRYAEISVILNKTPKAVKCKAHRSGLCIILPINPDKVCLYCGKNIISQENTFCDSSCAAKYNNPKRKKVYNCIQCGKDVGRHSKYCGHKCQREYEYINTTLIKFYSGLVSERKTLRKILGRIRGEKCQLCGVTEWNGKALTFIVDHADGDAGNNTPDNVRLCCPNCDSQSEFYTGRNRGNGRKSRGIKRTY
jgi:hypothetical protein